MMKQTPTAAMPTSAPLNGMRLPKKRIATKDVAMIAGMSQVQWRITASPSHRVDLVEVDRGSVAIQHQDDGEPDPDFGRGDRDDEQREHLPDHGAVERAECNEVDVHGVEDELDRHQDHHAVAPGEHAVDPDREQGRAKEQELVQKHAAIPSWPG